MPAPQISVAVGGTGPGVASREQLEATTNAALLSLYNQIVSAATGLTPMGGFDASGGVFPAATARGQFFFVTTAGTVDGQAFAPGDWLVALSDAPSTATYAGHWVRAPYAGITPTVYANPATLILATEGSRGLGAVWETRDGHRYEEVASGGDIVNSAASPVHLSAVPGQFGVNVRALGALGDGVNDDTSALQKAIDKGGAVYLPRGTYRTTSELAFRASAQKISGEGPASALHLDHGGTGIDFDGWPACEVQDLMLYSTQAARAIRIGHNSAQTRFAHFGGLTRVRVLGDVPDWGRTDLSAARVGFADAGIELKKCFYISITDCFSSNCVGAGYKLHDQANGNTLTAITARENGIGVLVQGQNSSNGNMVVMKVVEASFDGSIGVLVSDADRCVFMGRMEVTGAGSVHVKIEAPTDVAQALTFLGVECLGGGTPGFEIGGSGGSNRVRGTIISNCTIGTGITVHSDAQDTLIDLTGFAQSGTTIVDNGIDTVLRGDAATTDGYYSKVGALKQLQMLITPEGLEMGPEVGSTRLGSNGTTVLEVDSNATELSAALRVGGSATGGAPGVLELSNSHNLDVTRGSGVGTIRFADGVDRACIGFLQFSIDGTTIFIPVFASN